MSQASPSGVAVPPIESVRSATFRALISDLGQRAVSLNKLEQKRHFATRIRQLGVLPGSKVLDFGCGTGLFARTFWRLGLKYYGYDVDEGLLVYARLLRPWLTFVSSLEEACAYGPFDVIVANCCLHHIPDLELATVTLPDLARMMTPESKLMLVDVLPLEPKSSAIRRLYNCLEQGSFKRTADELDRFLSPRFTTRSKTLRRSHFLALSSRLNPIYNNLVAYDLILREDPR
jgi:2-polyprenyl-3-methyl-5-hydroxy-6-metoxy-1,4-benzoquinol methylase